MLENEELHVAQSPNVTLVMQPIIILSYLNNMHWHKKRPPFDP
jgi:hypothetical protein